MPPPKDPIKREEWIQKIKEGCQKRSKDPEWIRKNKEVGYKNSQNPEWRRNGKEAAQKFSKDPEWIRKRKKIYKNPEWIRKTTEVNQKKARDPEWIRKTTEANQKKARDPEWIRKHKKLCENPEWQLANMEGLYGGFWFGKVKYPDPPLYCELWCPDLWLRIDEAQNYQSILSGKTKEDNICKNGKTRALSRHHVYWQPKACCEWDEDAQGYYAWIEAGTPKHPNLVKYYIKGDPNKFVLLTMSEHKMISKDKLKWIGIFEELIETKLGGVCYLPKVNV